VATAGFQLVRDQWTPATARLLSELKAAETPGASPAMDWLQKQWLDVYSTFIKRRFDRSSKGGGDWPALALSTIQRRRKGVNPSKRSGRGVGDRSSLARDTRRGGQLVSGGGGAFSILRDTGTMFNALSLSNAANASAPIPLGVAYGFREVPHPGKGTMTIARLAAIHDAGNVEGGLPRREIVVAPDSETIDVLGRALKSYLARITREAAAVPPVTGGGARGGVA